MGLFDLFRRRGSETSPSSTGSPSTGSSSATPATPPETSPPVAVVVVRQGMNVAPDDYAAQVISSAHPELAAVDLVRRALSQPRWFVNSDAMQSAATAIALAYKDELDIDPDAREYELTTGPEGAKIMLVLLYR